MEVHSLSRHHGFWGFMYNFNINTAGFAIVGMFVATWAVAVLVWRYGHIEEKWSARLQTAGASLEVVPDALIDLSSRTNVPSLRD
jgi:hypothetical protein